MRSARRKPVPQRSCPHCGANFDAEKSLCTVCHKFADASPDRSALVAIAPSLAEVKAPLEPERLRSGPWDPVFGGGLVVTSVAVLAAQPGAGKTTMCLQMSDAVARIYKRKTLFISSEMLDDEAKGYAGRLQLTEFHNIHIMSLKLSLEPLDMIEAVLDWLKPALVVLDSVSSLAKGDFVEELRMCALAKRLAGIYRAPWVIIAHINKDGEMAGKETVQHDVDAVLSFHIDANGTRILECPSKNRNGPTPVFVAFDMTERGLVHRPMKVRPPAVPYEGAEEEEETEETEDDGEELDLDNEEEDSPAMEAPGDAPAIAP